MRASMFLVPAALLAACGANTPPAAAETSTSTAIAPFKTENVARFKEPWAMAFLPGTTRLFVTEKAGTLKVIDTATRQTAIVAGSPVVSYGGQGGFGDIAFAPIANPDGSRDIWLSHVAAWDHGARGAVVSKGRLVCTQAMECRLDGLTPIWTQRPAVLGGGHFSHRLALSPDGKSLFISSGERQKFDPAQDPASDLGKIIRLDLGTGKAEHWTLGHRNVLGLAFDAAGNLWADEMGPKGGDELNLIVNGRNYGWPKVSNGSHYDGRDIPDHAPGDGFAAPKLWWNPSISTSSLMIYTGKLFPQWQGDAFVGALSGEALIRIDLNGETATKADHWNMGTRIREVEQGPDGAIWLLEDGDAGRLFKLVPAA